MIGNEQVKILLDFQIQTDKLVMNNQPDIVVDEHQRTAVVVNEAIPRDGNIRKKEQEKKSCNLQDGLVAPADTRNNI